MCVEYAYCSSEVYGRRSHTQTYLSARWASKLTRRANEREPANDRLCVVVRGSFMLYVFVPKSRKDLFSWKSYEPQNRRALIEVPWCLFVVWSPQLFAHSLHSVRIGYSFTEIGSILLHCTQLSCKLLTAECMRHCYLSFFIPGILKIKKKFFHRSFI